MYYEILDLPEKDAMHYLKYLQVLSYQSYYEGLDFTFPQLDRLLNTNDFAFCLYIWNHFDESCFTELNTNKNFPKSKAELRAILDAQPIEPPVSPDLSMDEIKHIFFTSAGVDPEFVDSPMIPEDLVVDDIPERHHKRFQRTLNHQIKKSATQSAACGFEPCGEVVENSATVEELPVIEDTECAVEFLKKYWKCEVLVYAPPFSGKSKLNECGMFHDTDFITRWKGNPQYIITNRHDLLGIGRMNYALLCSRRSFNMRCAKRGLTPGVNWYNDVLKSCTRADYVVRSEKPLSETKFHSLVRRWNQRPDSSSREN